jgi:hypothetical protein
MQKDFSKLRAGEKRFDSGDSNPYSAAVYSVNRSAWHLVCARKLYTQNPNGGAKPCIYHD